MGGEKLKLRFLIFYRKSFTSQVAPDSTVQCGGFRLEIHSSAVILLPISGSSFFPPQ
jgi:hypothetical protein